MPDASASRKRQIQITPRTFRGARRFARVPHERPISGIARLDACFPGSVVSATRKTAQHRRGERDARPDLRGEFSPRGYLTRFRNRVKLIRRHRRPDSIPRKLRVPDRGARAQALPRSINASDPAKDQASIIFCRFFALFGRPSTVRHPSRPTPRMR